MKNETRRPMRPVRPSRAREGLAPRGAETDPLDVFFADIRDTPVLTAEQEVELGQTMREQRSAMLATLARIPGTSGRIADQWHERAESKLVPHRLSEVHDGRAEIQARLDETLEEIEGALESWNRARSAKGRERAAQRLVQPLIDFDPRTSLMLDWLEELEKDLKRPTHAEESWGLPYEELRPLVRLAAGYRDAYLEARSTFVRHNLRFVVHMAKDARHLGIPFADLIQEGNLGLIRAVEKFDERRGFRFSTYASWWIDQAFRRSFQKDARVVRLPSQLLDRQRHLRAAETRLTAKLGRAPTEMELAEALDVTIDEVALAQRTAEPESSLDLGVGDGEDRSWIDALADESIEEPSTELDRTRCAADVAELLRALPTRERRVLIERFGLGSDEPRTLQALAAEFGLSRERIRQIEKGALERVRGLAERGGLRGHL